jgi:hypothetical protein
MIQFAAQDCCTSYPLASTFHSDRRADLETCWCTGAAWSRSTPSAFFVHHTPIPQDVRQAGPRAHADRVGRLPPRLPSRTGPARRSRRPRTSHHGVEKRTAAHACRRFKRKNGGFWRAQFCTEVARPTGFEPVTFVFRERRLVIDQMSVTHCQTVGEWPPFAHSRRTVPERESVPSCALESVGQRERLWARSISSASFLRSAGSTRSFDPIS